MVVLSQRRVKTCEMCRWWREAAVKYISKTKAFVSTSSMLFVLAGYGGSLYDIWMNGVWGDVRQKWNPLAHTPAPRKKDLLWQRGLTEEANLRLKWSLQSSFLCKHSRAAATSAAFLVSCLFIACLWGLNERLMTASWVERGPPCTIVRRTGGCLCTLLTAQGGFGETASLRKSLKRTTAWLVGSKSTKRDVCYCSVEVF